MGIILALAAVPGLAAVRRTRGGSLAPAMLVPAVAFFVLAYPGPAGIEEGMGFEDIGMRFTLSALLFALGAVRLTPRPAVQWPLALTVAVLGGLVLTDTWRVHHAYQAEMRAVSGLLARVPRHARLLPLLDIEEPTRGEYLLHRAGNWATVERDAYSPHVFARTGQQPLRHRYFGDYRPVERPLGADEWAFYDLILLQARDALPDWTARAVLVARAGQFRLYRAGRTLP